MATPRTKTYLLGVFPDNDNQQIRPAHDRDFIESTVPNGRVYDFVLATSDASIYQKARADDVMTGVDDQAKIVTALASLPAAGGSLAIIGPNAYCTIDADGDQIQCANGNHIAIMPGTTINATITGTNRWLFVVDGSSSEKQNIAFLGNGKVLVTGSSDNQGWLRVKGQFKDIFVSPHLQLHAASAVSSQGPGLYVSGDAGFGGRDCHFGGRYENWAFESSDDEDGPVMADGHLHDCTFDLDVRKSSYGLSLYFRDFLPSYVGTWNHANFNELTNAADGSISAPYSSTNLNRAPDATDPIGDWIAMKLTKPADGLVWFMGATKNTVPGRLIFETLGPAITGTHTNPDTSGSNDYLVDATKNFKTLGVRVGSVVRNVTDGSEMVVTNVVGTTELRGTLYGGTDNNWQTGDSYRVTWRAHNILVDDTSVAGVPWAKSGEVVWTRPREDEWDSAGDAGLSIGQAALGAGYWCRVRIQEADGSAANPDSIDLAEVLMYRLPQDCLIGGKARQLSRSGIHVRGGHRIKSIGHWSDGGNHGINWNSHQWESIVVGSIGGDNRPVRTRWCDDFSEVANFRDTMLLTRAAADCWFHGKYTGGETAGWEQDAGCDWEKSIRCGLAKGAVLDGFEYEAVRIVGDYTEVLGTIGRCGRGYTTDVSKRSAVNVRRNWGNGEMGGTHDGANNSATLADSTADFVALGVKVNDRVRNKTDGSSMLVTAVTDETLSGTLSGGTDNDWDAGDEYDVAISEPIGTVLDFQSADTVGLSTTYAVHVDQGLAPITQDVYVLGGRWAGMTTPVLDASGVIKFKGLVAGAVVQNSGQATVASGATTVVVNHGLLRAPAIEDIRLTPVGDIGSATKYWVSAVTATQFTINVNTAPGGSGAPFGWLATIVK